MTEPAIRTTHFEQYSLRTERIETIGSDTRFHRGLGQTGTRVELVDMSNTKYGGCPRCGESEMVLSRGLNLEGDDSAAFYCTNLKCPHFVGSEVEHDMNRIRSSTPAIWDNTAECPGCGTRHTVEVRRNSRLHQKANEGLSDIIEEPCSDCKREVEA